MRFEGNTAVSTEHPNRSFGLNTIFFHGCCCGTDATPATRKMRWNARETTSTPAKVWRDSTAVSGRSAQFESTPPTRSSGLWRRKSTATARSSTPPDGQNENSGVEPQSHLFGTDASRRRTDASGSSREAFLWTLMMMSKEQTCFTAGPHKEANTLDRKKPGRRIGGMSYKKKYIVKVALK